MVGSLGSSLPKRDGYSDASSTDRHLMWSPMVFLSNSAGILGLVAERIGEALNERAAL